MIVNRTCKECHNKTVEVSTYPWSKTIVNCKNCGAHFKLKDYFVWPFLFFLEISIPFGLLILLYYAVLYWYFAIPMAVISVFILEYLKRRLAGLKLVGLRAKLKEKGVYIDPNKSAAAKRKL